jgi:hypothetical protein
MIKPLPIPVARIIAYDRNHKLLYDIKGFTNNEVMNKEREILEEFPEIEMEIYELHVSKIDKTMILSRRR